MSFSSLPQELVDNIARFVDVKPVWDQKDDFEHILSLSLVSKQTLASSRRVLYHEPFDRWEYQDDLITWRRARKLLKSLEANGGRFGKLVRKTNGIRGWMHELDETTQATESKSGGLLSWYQRVLRACPLLRQVDFIFSTERQMYCAFRILFFDLPEPHASTYSTSPLSPTSTIREIAFLGCPVGFLDTPRVSCAKVFSALRCSSIISLGSVTFYRVDWSMEEVNSTIALLPFRLRRLKMSTLFGGQSAPPPVLFSRSTETLEHVDLSGKAVLARFDLSALPSILGTNLQTLSMKFDSDWEIDRALSTYTSYHDTPPLCPETFASFPHLENLELSATHGLSLRLLETLAKASPLLSTLQFYYSRWISDQKPPSTDPDDIFPEPEIIAVLCKFPCLSLVDLGVLPALDRSRYQDMEDTLFEERIWASYDVYSPQTSTRYTSSYTDTTKMSFSSLPQELVDQIAFLVGNDEEGLDNVIDVKSVYNFCLISKDTTSSGQACLYRRPFISLTSLFERRSGLNEMTELQFAEGRIVKLLTALEANENRLGQLARGTLGISYYLIILGKDDQHRKWYIEVLRACPNLQEVNLNFRTITELEAILEALHLSTPVPVISTLQITPRSSAKPVQLKSITFDYAFYEPERTNAFDLSNVFAALEQVSLPALTTVKISDLQWTLALPTNPIPFFPFPIKHLLVATFGSDLADSISFFPRLPSTLESFSFSTHVICATDLTPITMLVGEHLRKLELQFNESQRYDRLRLRDYTASICDVKIPLEGFRSYPHLTSLTVSGTRGPSLLFTSSSYP